MIVILDYDMGNIGSIKNMLKLITKTPVVITNDKDIIKQADKLILPGVGAFDAGINNIKKLDLMDSIYEHAVQKKKPILGICLGMQLLGIDSEEGTEKGLALIPFHTRYFSNICNPQLKIPHMGWNYVEIHQKNDPLTKELSENERYYFVHSYYATCEEQENVLMTCNYGSSFAAAVKKENIYGVQFHPEKSHKYGMKLLKNFVMEV